MTYLLSNNMKATVIGSGFSGSVTSFFLLKKGFKVDMYDIGYLPNKIDLFDNKHLDQIQSFDYFFGDKNQSFVNYYDDEIFKISNLVKSNASKDKDFTSFKAIQSNDFLGHGKAWGVNMHSFDEDDIKDWPIKFSEYSKYLKEFLNYCKISSRNDDMNQFYPKNFINQKCFNISTADQDLLNKYQNNIIKNNFHHFFLGHSRLGLNMINYNKKRSSKLWFDDNKNLKFNPGYNFFSKIIKNKSFNYYPYKKVNKFIYNNLKIDSIDVIDLKSKKNKILSVSNLFLCAGTINSANIYLSSLNKKKHVIKKLNILDNKVIKIVFLNPRLFFKNNNNKDLPFNRLSGVKLQRKFKNFPKYIHFEILNFQNLLQTPISRFLPFGFKFSSILLSKLSESLGVLTVFMPDKVNNNCYIKLNNDNNFKINYKDSLEKKLFSKYLKTKLFFDLLRNFCIPIKILVPKSGNGIHYAGTMPMGNKLHGVNSNCKSNFLKNLYITDGSVFPSLPSKSITFNIMYNAFRVIKNLKIKKIEK